jgi:hypothetical protein
VAQVLITIIGEAFDALGHRWNGTTISTAEPRSRQEDLIPLTLDHTELAGRVLTLTRVKGGAVWGIAVAEGCDALLEADAPINFSPSTEPAHPTAPTGSFSISRSPSAQPVSRRSPSW